MFDFFVCIYLCRSDGLYNERRSYKKGKRQNKIAHFQWASHCPKGCMTTQGQTQASGAWTLFKSIIYLVTVQILLVCSTMAWTWTTKQLALLSPSGLSTLMKWLIRNGWFGKRFVIINRSYKHHAPGDVWDIKQCPNWTNEDFFFLAVWTAAEVD